MLGLKVLVVDVRLGEVVETTVVVHEAACALIRDEGAIGEGALGRGGGGKGDRLGWLVKLDTCQLQIAGRREGTDQAVVVELVEGGQGTQTFCRLFVGMVAYGGDLGVGVEEEGAAVGGVSGERGGRERTDRKMGRLAVESKRLVN